MHEFSIAQNIMGIILAEAKKAKAQKVLKVHLRIGELAQVFPGSLSFCFDFCAKGTIVEAAKLTIERVPVRVYCSSCDETLLVENNRYFCKNCGNLKIELVTGRELQINHLEIEDEAN
jgi:hydrogenase nickel incorporation protein HypA/HybF